ncbi:hypothetical protein LRP31_02740 [Mesorhizobium mediterraneum]|uniref:Lipoprotein n=1 Tax=Mesorhizobium mediterraneum TaxID=43617 RepID=A0AB36RDF7_9HYPH|nr:MULTISPECIES: hypothetical protein [Mesorhizobium]RUU26639.1 hypothetical protein EOD08_22480 [Mesorhizobium sp. M6A.T.Ca.TU.002.02.2.1]PAQ02476.1 hypothetical protein CIT25_11140 [Mesorhizobium mediterraneum]RUU40782.1 hypothetical protein EOC93_20720 [Mesorhizobium sp. M6A.T.Ce.TU.002.03.1.1]RUU98373.1 hypothetical protein EOB36_23930 [Mesorhizobium sp. M6A.T.Cr.TU.017.01.1.1]RVB77170.1 hypothetical protein EN885_13555 [Mesorhizobium sp. M6A.T.Cr.TU.014.01.1.1]
MRIAMFVALAATVAGCAISPVDYGASLSKQDQKWASPGCQQARMEASDYDAREKKQPGWGTGVFLGPYGLGLAAAIKEHQQKQRKLFAREVHLRCSSLPLPTELQRDLSPQAASANQTKYP